MSDMREAPQPLFYDVHDLMRLLGMEYETARRQMQAFAKMGITEKLGRQTKVYRESFHELYKPARIKPRPQPRDNWKIMNGGKRDV